MLYHVKTNVKIAIQSTTKDQKLYAMTHFIYNTLLSGKQKKYILVNFTYQKQTY